MKHKARLIAKGCSQIPGVDFVEMFTPVMCLETLWLSLALMMELGLVIHVVDMVGPYLNSTLEEIIFMMQPLELVLEGLVGLWLQPLLAATTTTTGCLTYKNSPTTTATATNWLVTGCCWVATYIYVH
jgi:Reverse transcriptase (RNA-dependent DNA polymerase)